MAVKLSERDSDILAFSCFQANASAAAIAKQSGYREHVVRNCLRRLRDLEIVRPVLQINPYVLGYTEYYTFFAIENSASGYQRAVKALTSTPEIFWVGEFGTAYRFAASILAKGPRDLARILDSVSIKIGSALKERAVTICHSLYSMQPHVYSSRAVPVPSSWYGDVGETVAIDSLDHQILRNLSKDPLMTLSQLSRKVGSPISTLEYRVASLKEQGVIVAYEYVTNEERLGTSTFPVALYLRRNTPDVQKKILDFALSTPQVTYLAFLIGRWDAEFGVRVKHPREISAVLEGINELLGPDINRLEFYPYFQVLKLEYYPFDAFVTPVKK